MLIILRLRDRVSQAALSAQFYLLLDLHVAREQEDILKTISCEHRGPTHPPSVQAFCLRVATNQKTVGLCVRFIRIISNPESFNVTWSWKQSEQF